MDASPHLSTSVAFALASYAVSVTGLVLACAVWLRLFSLPAGTNVRPMGEAVISTFVAGAGTLGGLTLAIACILSGRTRVLPWLLGILCAIVAVLPLPAATVFSDWVMQTQGLTPLP